MSGGSYIQLLGSLLHADNTSLGKIQLLSEWLIQVTESTQFQIAGADQLMDSRHGIELLNSLGKYTWDWSMIVKVLWREREDIWGERQSMAFNQELVNIQVLKWDIVKSTLNHTQWTRSSTRMLTNKTDWVKFCIPMLSTCHFSINKIYRLQMDTPLINNVQKSTKVKNVIWITHLTYGGTIQNWIISTNGLATYTLTEAGYHSSTLTILTIWMHTFTESILIGQKCTYTELCSGDTENMEAAWIVYLFTGVCILLSSDYILAHDKYHWQRVCHICISVNRRQIFSIHNIHRMVSIWC